MHLLYYSICDPLMCMKDKAIYNEMMVFNDVVELCIELETIQFGALVLKVFIDDNYRPLLLYNVALSPPFWYLMI